MSLCLNLQIFVINEFTFTLLIFDCLVVILNQMKIIEDVVTSTNFSTENDFCQIGIC